MDFFERQERSKRSSVVLIILFLLCTLCICIAVSYPICLLLLYIWRDLKSFHPAYVFTHIPLSFLLILFLCVFAYIAYKSNQKIKELSKGGGEYIMRLLQGRLTSKRTAGSKESALLNVVEEIAIASGIPPPPVYILDADHTINAFAAGFTCDDAIIGVTAGTVEHLTREELQGVLAHEFSHIFNGDMRLNTYTIGILNGISSIGHAGRNLFTSSRFREIIALGAALYVIGYAGLFLGNLIKAAINREREFLADSTAAQFTRHPKALADALKKIGGLGSFLSSARSDEFSHFYFASGNRFALFNTHPSIDKRIYALDPRWDGIYILTESSIALINAQAEHAKAYIEKEKKNREKAAKLMTAAIWGRTVETPGKLDDAAVIIKNIPQILYVGATNVPDAQFIIFAVLSECDGEISEIQKELIAKVYFEESTESAEKFETIRSEVQKYPRDLYLNLVYICIPTLKSLSKEEYLKFKETLTKLI
jgi:Zn-dependent protease with chaperone function